MRYGRERKAATRQRLVEEAAKVLRHRGLAGTGVANVSAAAGLTHGAFYAHFESRDELIAEGVAEMFTRNHAVDALSDPGMGAGDALGVYIDFYLSTTHRDGLGASCPLPYLAAEYGRLPSRAQAIVDSGLIRLTRILSARLAALGVAEPEAEASSLISELVGATTLARAEPNPERSQARLRASRRALRRRLGLPPDAAATPPSQG